MVEEGVPPAKRPHLEEKRDQMAVCNGGVPEPLEDYTKMGTLPPPTKSVKVTKSINCSLTSTLVLCYI